MTQWTAFLRKEWIHLIRNGRLWISLAVFSFFGIMNPAITKLTPWMIKHFSSSFSESGLIVGQIRINALTSWSQFDKNYSLLLILFLLLFSSILTTEYQKKTLIPIVAKGMPRWKILTSKLVITLSVWTAGYWLCVIITYGYNAYFWNNTVICHLSSYCIFLYLTGVWMIFVLIAASAALTSNVAVLSVSALEFVIVYCLGMLNPLESYMPSYLIRGAGLLSGIRQPSDYTAAIFVLILFLLFHLGTALFFFHRSKLTS